jgi:hypothetical protein
MSIELVKPHKQLPCKVTAYVDKGIINLVQILNSFEGIETLSSCQGGDCDLAFVEMQYFPKSKTLHFITRLIKALNSKSNETYDVVISMEWHNNKQQPIIIIEMPSDRIPIVTKLFSDAKAEIFYNI